MQLLAAVVLPCAVLLMELCWLGAWSAFIWAAFLERTFPLTDMLVCAGLAVGFVRTARRARLRNVLVLALHALCMIAFWFCDRAHLRVRDADSTALPVLLALATSAFWTSGVLHARRTLTHSVVCARFDLGMYWLLALLGMRLLLRGQAQVPQQAEISDALVPCFFVNAMCAISVARYRDHLSKEWLRISGPVLMLFGLLVVLAALFFSVTWMFRPYLRALAEASQRGAVIVARPMANAAAELLISALREGRKHPTPAYLPGRLPAPHVGRRQLQDESLQLRAVDEVPLTVVAIAAAILASIGALAWLWWKRRWLWSRQRRDAPAGELSGLWVRLFRRARAWLRALGRQAEPEPLRLVTALLTWGERSGIPRASAETPLEYARRLKSSFAAMSGQIDSIVDCHGQQTYALGSCSAPKLHQARRALRQLRSPRHWWLRSRVRWRALHTRSD